MKVTNQPKANTSNLKKFADVSLNAEQTAKIKGGNGEDVPPVSAIIDDIVNG